MRKFVLLLKDLQLIYSLSVNDLLLRYKFQITIGFILHCFLSFFALLDLGLKLFLTMLKHIIIMLIF